MTYDGKFYYLRISKPPSELEQEAKQSISQLWVVDTSNRKDYKIADNVSLVRPYLLTVDYEAGDPLQPSQ